MSNPIKVLKKGHIPQLIKEQKQDNITNFLHYSGFEIEESIPEDKFNSIVGKENNIFCEDYIEYNVLYEFISGIKNKNGIIDSKEEKQYKNTNNRFKSNFTRILILLATVGLWILNFFRIDGPYVFKCAKGFGLNLRIWSILLPILMCRSLLNGKIEHNISYHVFIGYIYFICMIGHTICHFIYHIDYNQQYITGFILSIITLLIGISSYYRYLKYDIFFYVHRLNYLFLPLLLVHITDLWIWFTVALCIILLEHLYNILLKTQISTLINSKISKYEDIVYLSFHCALKSATGSYYRIMIPSISTEWHSFSVANTHLVDQLLFIIAVRGDWTKKLKEKLINKSNDIAIIMGPYYTCSTQILNDESEKILCIAGGIGIAPFISVIDTKIQLSRINDNYRSNFLDRSQEILNQEKSISFPTMNFEIGKNKKNKLQIVWIIRKPEDLISYIDNVIEKSTVVNFKIYITGKFTKEEDIKNKWSMLKRLENSNIEAYFIKPNLEKIINCDKFDKVFFCGSERLEDDIKEICSNNKIPLYCEKFD